MTTTHENDEKYPEIESRMQRAHDWWQPRDISRQEFYDALTPATRAACAVGHLNYQVENGGFSQWHFNGYCVAGYAPLRALCKRIGTPVAMQVAELLRDAIEACEYNERMDRSGEGDEDAYKSTDAFDKAYYAIAEQWLAQAEAAIKAMAEESAP
jgi:hypothetical protein